MKLSRDDLARVETVKVGARGTGCYVATVAVDSQRSQTMYVAFWTYRALEIHASYGSGPTEEHAIADLFRLGAAGERDQIAKLSGPDKDKKKAACAAAWNIIQSSGSHGIVEIQNALADLYDIAWGQGSEQWDTR